MDKKVLFLFIFVTASNWLYGAFLPLHADEAYYWTWSRNLQLSYFDHPPMIAYLIKLCTVFSASEWAIRMVSVFSVSGSALMVYALARKMFSHKVAELAFVLFLFLPISQIGVQTVAPDLPLIFFWSTTLYFLYRAVFETERNSFYFAGVTAGLMMLSKYTGVLLLPALLLFLLSTRYRKVLLAKPIYLSLLLAIIIFSPVLIWNSAHDWISFKFQFAHGIAAAKRFDLQTLEMFLGGQAGIANPFFFVAMLYYTLKSVKTNVTDEKLAFLFWPFIFVFGFFFYAAMFKKVEPNWPAPAYITGVILLAYWLQQCRNRWLPVAGITLTIALILLVRFPEAFPFLPNKAVLKAPYYGNKELYQASNQYLSSDKTIVLSDSYQSASLAWYYLDGRPEVYIITSARISNYDFWKTQLVGKPIVEALYLGGVEKLPELQTLFKQVEQLDVLTFNNGYVNRTLHVFKCHDFRGFVERRYHDR